MRGRDFFLRWSLAFADIVVLGAVYRFFLQKQYDGVWISYSLWLALLTVCLLVNSLVRHFRFTYNSIIGLNALLAAAVAFCERYMLAASEIGVGHRLLFAAFLAASAIHTAMMCYEKPRQDTLAITLDVVIVVTAVSIAMGGLPPAGAGQGAASGLFPVGTVSDISRGNTSGAVGVVSCICLFLSLMIYRLRPRSGMTTDSGHNWRGTLAAVSLLALMLLVIGLITLSSEGGLEVISTGVGGGLAAVTGGLRGALRAAEHGLGAFLRWLLPLMHIESSEWTPEESGVVMGNAEASGDGGSPAALILIAVIAVLMLAGLLRTIRRLRGKRITSEVYRGEDSAVASMGITQGVGRLWRGIRDRVAFAYQLLRHRDSAGALFVMTERRLRRKGLARSAKETPSAYLRRLSDEIQKKAESKVDGKVDGKADNMADGRRENGNYFCQLADILERQYYRGQATALPEGFAEEYRRLLRAYIRSTEPRGDL